ncbi:hypothetical protein WR25_10092 [Diploscapter pachys]|uniref:Uncharacterized protein n=1 Tax=Diploscapter pachys TaxID=2018661 RepID=A0A2A2LFC3_9BILA|nr:hypothetical protein WR25_10092 [Diploscapter pachys]
MTDCPMEKKPRLWNPGIDSVEVVDFSKESTPASKPSSPESKSGLKPNSPTFGPLPLNPQAATFLQNYLQIAPLFMRIQQQKNLEDFISSRRSSLSSLQTPTISPLTPPLPSFDPYQLPLISNRQPPAPIPIIPTSTTSPTTRSQPLYHNRLVQRLFHLLHQQTPSCNQCWDCLF